jgi:acyl-CoA reductase-like NAD-dependent aldehyde dehydrogenase
MAKKAILNPASGERIGWLREHDARDMASAMRRARTAQTAWAALPVARRAGVIRSMRARIVARADGIAEIISRSTGKTRVDAMSTEVVPIAVALSYYARVAPHALRERRIRRSNPLFFNKVSRLARVPYGVVGIISPWNYPFGIPFHEISLALLAGNAVILKVATQAQLVGEAIADVVKASGLPAGLFHLLHLPGTAAAQAMIEAGVDKLSFTGSSATGRQIMARAAAKLIPVTLELGGNDAMIVLDDANLERAAAGTLWGGLSNTGQSCAAVERVYVEKGAWQGFREHLRNQVQRLRVGPDRDFDVDVGSLASMDQKRKIEDLVRDALKRGARILAQSGPAGGLFHPILVLEGADASMRVMREEVFGPVIALARVRDEQEAIALANDSIYGLSASVWSGSRRRARRVASRLRVGSVTINDHLMSHAMPETPWGGFGASGIGRTHGELGLHEMTQPRVVVEDRLPGLPRDMWWYPHDRSVHDGLKGAIDGMYGRGLARRAAGLAALARTFFRSFRAG